MEKFTTHKGIVAVLNRGNVDTDQIISKEFLKSILRTGFGDALFAHWRFSDDGKVNADFELNDPAYKNASILIAGNNFGCGSSREHAVWAVLQYGFRAVIAPQVKQGNELIPGFADIFKNNSFKNGLLLIEYPKETVDTISDLVLKNKGVSATLDLQAQTFTLNLASGDKSFPFQIDAGIKDKLLQGLDEIGVSLTQLPQIEKFEKTHAVWMA